MIAESMHRKSCKKILWPKILTQEEQYPSLSMQSKFLHWTTSTDEGIHNSIIQHGSNEVLYFILDAFNMA